MVMRTPNFSHCPQLQEYLVVSKWRCSESTSIDAFIIVAGYSDLEANLLPNDITILKLEASLGLGSSAETPSCL